MGCQGENLEHLGSYPLSPFLFTVVVDGVEELWESKISGSSLGLCFDGFQRPQSFFHSVRLEGCCNLVSLFL